MSVEEQQQPQSAKAASKAFYSVLVLLALGFVGYFVKLGFNIFLARHLSVALYGDFSLGVRILGIASSFVLLGTDTSAKRFVARFLREKKHDKIHTYLSWNMRLILVTSLICCALVILSFMTVLSLHLSNVLIIQKLHVIVYLLWLTPLAALVALFGTFFSCNRNYNLSYFLTNFAKYVFIVGFAIVGIYYLDLSLNGLELAGMLLLSFFIMLTIELVGFKIYLPQSWRHSLKSSLKKTEGHDPQWLKTSANLITNNILFLLLSTLDLIIIEIVAPNEVAVGHYAAVLSVVAIIWAIPLSVNSYLAPNISHLIETKQFNLLQSRIVMTNLVSYTILIILVVLLNVFSHTIFGWFGKSFSGRVDDVFLIISIGAALVSCARVCPTLLAYGGQEHLLKWLSIMELIIMVVLGFPLTYFYSIEGMASTFFVAVVVKTIVMVVLVKRRFPLKPCIII